MKMFCKFLFAIGLGLATCLAAADPGSPRNGIDYLTLENPQPTDAGKKVEVIEFFGYFCSYCHAFDVTLAEWAEKQHRDVAFKRTHVRFSNNMALHQRLFYTLSAMGEPAKSLHHKVFDAVQVQRIPLRNERQIADFVQKNGITPDKFMEMFRSFTVQSLSDGATQKQAAYQIDSVPTIVIDGRYITSLAIVSKGNPSITTEKEAQAMTIQIMDRLVARILKERQKQEKAITTRSRKK
jgi:thiol:disulfide interchange protein DsbA